MEQASLMHFPASIATKDARLFWLLLRELYRAGFFSESDLLIRSDWSELTEDVDAEDIASQLAIDFFVKDDLPRLQSISEGFAPDRHTIYFHRLREFGKKTPASKKCIGWMQSQRLIGKGLDGFKSALREGNADLARTLHQPSHSEAEALFYEITGLLNKESLSLLLFYCPALADIRSLLHAANSKANEEALMFLAWKIEESKDKNQLRNPNGDDTVLSSLFSQALCRRQLSFGKKLLDWNHALAFDKIEPKELAAPWDGDPVPIKLDGNLGMTPSDIACFYAHENFARVLGNIQSVPPNMTKITALLNAFSRKLDTRKPGSASEWLQKRLYDADKTSKIWKTAP